MSSEIERKFLLTGLPDWLAERAGKSILQGYLTNGEGPEVRLRQAGEQTLLTVKKGSGEVREEIEVEVGETLFESLWPLTEGRRLEKTRLREPLGYGLDAEVDVYEGTLEGLVVAEVEFDSEENSRSFQPPPWLGEEVTGDARYANKNLAGSGAPPARKAKHNPPSRSFLLKRKEAVDDGLRRIVHGRIEQAIESLREELPDNPAEAIHAARKDLKKIRSVLRLARSRLGEEVYAAENERYRNIARGLSGSRDAEVKVLTLDALEERYAQEIPSASVWGWRRMLARERDEAASAAAEGRSDLAATTIEALEAGAEAIDELPFGGDSWKPIGTGLRRSYERGRLAMDAVARNPDPELVHQWRKRAKDLWYQLRLLRRAWPGLLEPTVDCVHALADQLGDHHDLTVLREDLVAREGVGSKAQLGTLIERRQEELLGEALALGERLYVEKPKAFTRRIRRYWDAWR